jgi:hypothetical protein
MKDGSLTFKLEHLDRYAIVNEPCTLIVKNNSRITMDDLYTGDKSPRWILNLKVISEFNLNLLKDLCKEGTRLTYDNMGHLLMTGALWEDQITRDAELPSKGEEMIAVFGYVNEVLMCTNITLIPRRQPDIYLYSSECMDEINEFEQIIKDMRNE